MSETVIIRGIKRDWFNKNFIEMKVIFGGDSVAIPKKDANFIGFYVEAPISAITHIGIVDSIDRTKGAVFNLKAIVKLDNAIRTQDGHAIRKQEYWTLKDLGINQIGLTINKFTKLGV